MTKLILADLNRGFLSDDGQIDTARLTNQITKLNQQNIKLGFFTELPYPKMLQLFKSIHEPLIFICESGAETVMNRVVKDEEVIDYSIWQSTLEWLQSERAFNSAYMVISGKMNAYTDAVVDSKAYQQFKVDYPSLYSMKHIERVSDLVYQIRLDFADGDVENLAQTFNRQFNGKLVAHAVANHLYITADQASSTNAIAGLSGDLLLSATDIELIRNEANGQPIDQILDTAAPNNGYDALDQLLADN